MCVIIHLRPNVLIPYDKLENAVYNNPHGYGLIMKDDGRLGVTKKFDEKGTDPKEVYELLERNIDVERYLHLRWKTVGDANLDNTQPFCGFNSDKRQVWFMHNGTLYDYKKKIADGTNVSGILQFKDDDSISDTRNFVETDLSELLAKIQGEKGIADIHDPLFLKMVCKLFGSSSKGLLISNDQDPIFLNRGQWATVPTGKYITTKDKKGITSSTEIRFLASNDDYFSALKRGPEFDRREKERKEKEEAARKANPVAIHSGNRVTSNAPVVTPITSDMFDRKFGIHKKIEGLEFDWDIHDPAGAAALANVTLAEWQALNEKSPEQVMNVMFYLSTHLKNVVDDNAKLTEKLDRASKRIESLKNGTDTTEEQDGSAAQAA